MLSSVRLFLLPCFLALSFTLYAQWQQVPIPLRLGFNDIVAHNGQLYGVTDGLQGIYASADGGNNWSKQWEGIRLFINPFDSSFYRIEWHNLLYRSTDEGANWTFIDSIPNDPSHFPRLSFASDTLYAYIRDNFYRRSPGSDWELLHVFGNQTLHHCIVRGPRIWVRTDDFIHYSADGGATWDFLPGLFNTAIGLAAAGDTLLVLHYVNGGGRGLSRSTDYGQSWQTVNTDLYRLSTHNRPFYAVTEQGDWYASYDGLNNWDILWPRAGAFLATDLETVDGQLYIATSNGIMHREAGLWKHGNVGSNPYGQPLSDLTLRYFDRYLFARTGAAIPFSDPAITFSTDNGDHWEKALGTVLPDVIYQTGPYSAGIYGNEFEYDFYRSGVDDQFYWKKYISPYSFRPTVIAVTNGKYYALNCCSSVKDMFRSTDQGANFEPTGGSLPAIPNGHDILLGLNGELFTRIDSTLIVSADEGLTWTVRHRFNFPITVNNARLFVVDGRILISQAGLRRLYRSDNGGLSFYPLPAPSAGSGAFALRVHGHTLVLIPGDGLVYTSTDLGDSWKQLPLPYPGFNLNSTANTLTANDSLLFLPDVAQGVAWRLQFTHLVQLRGTVFLDQDGDAQQDSNEPGLPGIVVSASGSNAYGVSDTAGHYSLFIDREGDSLQVTTNFAHYTPSPAWRAVQAIDTLTALDFAIQPLGVVTDAAIRLVAGSPFRPGFVTPLTLMVRNTGTLPAAGLLQLVLDPNLAFSSAEPLPASQAGDTIYWSFADLLPFQSLTFQLHAATALVSIGTPIHLQAEVVVGPDVVPADNVAILDGVVVASFDPNDKQVLPERVPLQSANDVALQYTIRFQNIGDLPTAFVVLRDTLSPRLDPGSLRLLATSHPVSWQIVADRVVEFRFDPLSLPPAAADEPASHGFVQFSVDLRPGAVNGEAVDNTAFIYFDYNAAVATNTVKTLIQNVVGVFGPGTERLSLLNIFPNPAKDYVWVDVQPWKSEGFTLLLVNQLGNIVFRKNVGRNGADREQLSLAAYPVGTYFLVLDAGGRRSIAKVIKL